MKINFQLQRKFSGIPFIQWDGKHVLRFFVYLHVAMNSRALIIPRTDEQGFLDKIIFSYLRSTRFP